MIGKIERYIIDKICKDGSIHMTLFDPEKNIDMDCEVIAKEAAAGGSSAIMVGGSTLASSQDLDFTVKKIKKSVDIPVILFPNGPVGVSPYADAIWFMSLLNSNNPYYLIDAQAFTAPVIKRYGLEAISLGYIIVGSGGAAGYVGMARKISYAHPELVVSYSMAAEALGMRFVYLEAGSGAERPIPSSTINLVSSSISIPLIVGGGIKDPKSAKLAANSGANIIVTGTMVEKENQIRGKIRGIVESISH
ncbi:MAG: geranylgeranylglyceryl/heptaprenylglyceryl phosphate synthase [Atribacterota bacterium]